MPLKTPVKRLLSLVFTLFLFSASSLAQTLLFSTGFEPNTTLNSLPSSSFSCGSGCSMFLGFSGTDNSTGFTFPLPQFGGSASVNGIRIEADGSGAWNTNYNDSIDTNAADCHSGSQCLYMEMMNYPNMICCPQQPVGQASLGQPLREFYERFWLKFPSSWSTVQANYGGFSSESIVYFKTEDDYRVEPAIWTDGSMCSSGTNCTQYGHAEVDDGAIASDKGYADPVTGTFIADPNANFKFTFVNNQSYNITNGTWHEVEFYLKRSPYPNDGRYFMAIDGHVVLDYYGISMGARTEDIQDFGYLQQYDGLYPDIKWVDDWEMWSTFPCAQLPCQTGGPGAGQALNGQAIPAYTTYNGAIGAVNVPFSYYLGTSVTPSSSGPAGGRNGTAGLPSWATYNISTGLITGTPTSEISCAGPSACEYDLQLNNSEGDNSFIPLFIMVNGAVQAPIIKYFWADGGTLKWVVLGAGTVSLSINNGVGSINNTNNQAMNGSTTVANSGTYTLTASNSAGSVTATATATATTTTPPTSPNPPTGLSATVN